MISSGLIAAVEFIIRKTKLSSLTWYLHKNTNTCDSSSQSLMEHNFIRFFLKKNKWINRFQHPVCKYFYLLAIGLWNPQQLFTTYDLFKMISYLFFSSLIVIMQAIHSSSAKQNLFTRKDGELTRRRLLMSLSLIGWNVFC